jgi:hypothetical protein
MQTDFITRCRARHAAASAAIILTLLQTCAAEAIVAGRGAGAMGRHVVRLISRSSECSGTAIGRQEVLTSAHCMISSKPYYVIARGRRIAVAGYSDNGGTATLRLAQPLPASVVPIEVGSGAGDFIIAGYGVSHESARAQSAGLREARLVERASHPSPTRACGDLTHFTAVGGSFFSSSFSDVKAAAAASPARRYVKAHRNKRVKVRPR